MKKIQDNDVDQILYDLCNDLLDDGVNPGLLTCLLSRHAMEISLSSCKEPEKIFFNILSGLFGPVSEKINTKPKCLTTKLDKAINDNNPKKLTIN